MLVFKSSTATYDWSRSGYPAGPPPAYSQLQNKRIDGWVSAVAASRLEVVDEEKHAPL